MNTQSLLGSFSPNDIFLLFGPFQSNGRSESFHVRCVEAGKEVSLLPVLGCLDTAEREHDLGTVCMGHEL